MSYQALARPNIAKLTAYSSARSIVNQGKIFLDANESPNFTQENFNRYPSPQSQELLKKFSALYEVDPENILMGRGSDEAIDILTRAFCEPGVDKILTTPPTYGMYKVSADIQNAVVVSVPLVFDGRGWQLNVENMIQKISEDNIKLVYVCSPNNPTGSIFSDEDIRKLCVAARGRALVVVDEAYIEFAPNFSSVSLMSEFSNLVILRTLSKAWALAGLRCGVLLANTEIVQLLQKVRAPYPIPQPVIEIALQILNPEGQARMKERVKFLISERERMAKVLLDNSWVKTVFPSQANFLLVRFTDEAKVMAAAAKEGIILRSRNSEIGLENCVRITIGTEEENNLLLKSLNAGDCV